MDLYEALKAGTTEEELLRAFHKDLEDAKKRIAAEQEEAKKNKATAESRKELVSAMSKYLEAIFGKEDAVKSEAVDELLLDFEKDLKQITRLTDSLSKVPHKNIVSDDDVIANFLKSLK